MAGKYEIISEVLSGDHRTKDSYETEEAMIDSLEHGDWSGVVILAIFDLSDNDVMENYDQYIHDENH